MKFLHKVSFCDTDAEDEFLVKRFSTKDGSYKIFIFNDVKHIMLEKVEFENMLNIIGKK